MLQVKHMLRHFTRADLSDEVKPLNAGITANRFLINYSSN